MFISLSYRCHHSSYSVAFKHLCLLKYQGSGSKDADTELHNLHSSPNIIKSIMIKSRRMKWAEIRTRTGNSSNAYMVVVVEKEKGHLEDLGVDERIILKWVLKK